MFIRLLLLMITAVLMASCHESFNSIYEDVVEPDPNVVPPEVVDLRNVNILPTLSDPLYQIDETRSWVGPFGNFDADKSHWLNTRFCTYGLNGCLVYICSVGEKLRAILESRET